MKEVVTSKKYKTSSPAYSICDEVLLYAGRVVMLVVLQKTNFEGISSGTSWYWTYESPDEELHLLAKYGQRY